VRRKEGRGGWWLENAWVGELLHTEEDCVVDLLD
jgi:hypothetical protein